MIASSNIYGQGLLHFSEMLEPFDYFNMEPQFNDNFIPVSGMAYNGVDANYQLINPGFAPMGKYLGIFQNDLSGIKNGNGNIVSAMEYMMWCEETLSPGWFVKWNNITFRVEKTNDWTQYSGFTQYQIVKIVGSDGQGVIPSNLSDGSVNYK